MIAHAELPASFVIRGMDARVVSSEYDGTGMARTIVDVDIPARPIHDAFHTAWDLFDDLADRVSFLSFTASYCSLISVTVARAQFGEVFDLALPMGAYSRSRVSIDAPILQAFDAVSQPSATGALRGFRSGLSSENPYRTYLELWRALELLSQEEALARGETVRDTCPHCSTEIDTGRAASQRVIREKYIKAKAPEKSEPEAASLANDARRLRGVLVHDARLENSELRQEVQLKSTSLQAATAVALVDVIGLKPLADKREYLGVPYLHLQLVRDSPTCDRPRIADAVFEVAVQFAGLSVEYTHSAPFEFMVGVQGPVPLDPICLPEFAA